MATLIPYFVTEKTPFGEKKIFDLIKQDKRTDDWIVFHSLGIEEHRTQFMGEADFVIISPTLGCFCDRGKGRRKNLCTGRQMDFYKS